MCLPSFPFPRRSASGGVTNGCPFLFLPPYETMGAWIKKRDQNRYNFRCCRQRLRHCVTLPQDWAISIRPKGRRPFAHCSGTLSMVGGISPNHWLFSCQGPCFRFRKRQYNSATIGCPSSIFSHFFTFPTSPTSTTTYTRNLAQPKRKKLQKNYQKTQKGGKTAHTNTTTSSRKAQPPQTTTTYGTN